MIKQIREIHIFFNIDEEKKDCVVNLKLEQLDDDLQDKIQQLVLKKYGEKDYYVGPY